MAESNTVEVVLGEAGVLAAVRWARWSTHRHVLEHYDPETGHDRAWLGTTSYTVLRDRLDRVFQCGAYQPPKDDAEAGRDVLAAGLRSGELELMPALPLGRVVRDGLNGSPGWRFEQWRFLLMSFDPGGIDRIYWSDKSDTKQQVASAPDPEQLGLVVDAGGELMMPDESPEGARHVDQVQTLVAAHALNPETGKGEIFLGRPRIAHDGEKCWHWRFQVHGDGGPDDTRGSRPSTPDPEGPESTGDTGADDLPLRLRQNPKEGRR
ncbi:hypothetical protein [Actinomycetospora sp. CA-053990]|uniref:hypothetical protein n=1 Tax=Actinomycetospora sp. CA-053990 TaxID=3239891 RepID=UPI003D8CDE72